MKFKKFSVLILMFIFAIGVTGCMNNENNNKNNEKIEKMTQYAEEKYGKEFTVEYFHAALDSTYKNMLTLSNEDTIFNVFYSEENDVMYDDYITNLISKKYADYIAKNCLLNGKDIEIYALVYLSADKTLDIKYVYDTDIKTIISESGVSKIFVSISTTSSIENIKVELFDLYNLILKSNPEKIEFNAISCSEKGIELEKNLTNINGYYDRSFDKYSEIDEYIHVIDKNIKSAEALINEVR